MDRRDQDLLDKQFRWLRPAPRSDGVLILAIAGMFVAGVAFSVNLVAHETGARQIVSSDAISFGVTQKAAK